jgi:hypothetical protein
MWSTEYTAVTPLPRASVWAALRGLHTAELTYDGADVFEPHGPFAVGSQLTVTPAGQGAFLSTIVELVENEVYADRTEFNGLTLFFRHTLADTEAGTSVTHRLEIDGEASDQVGPELGPQISGDFDDSMAKLFELAGAVASAPPAR